MNGSEGDGTDLDDEQGRPRADNAPSLHLSSTDAPRWVLPGVFVVVLLITVSRAPYVLMHGRFWAEEGAQHFRYMFGHDSPRGLLFVYGRSGYFDAFCNAATWLAAQVSLTRAPLVTVWLSFGVIAALVWVALFWPSRLLPTTGSRIAAAVLLVVGTLAVPEIWLNSLEAQTYLALLTLLLLFVRLRRLSRARFCFGAAMLATAGLSGVYADLLAPLFIVRALQQRTRRSAIFAAVLGVTATIQLGVVANLHESGKTGDTKLVFRGVGTIARNIAAYHVAGLLFGPDNADTLHRRAGRAHSVLGVVALSVLAIVTLAFLAVVLAHLPDRRVALALVGAFVIEELGVNYGAGSDSGGRFAVVPIGILILVLVHGAAAAQHQWMSATAAGLCGIVLLFGLSTFWTYQPSNLRCRGCPDWAQQVQQWQDGRIGRLDIWPYPDWNIPLGRHPSAAHVQASGGTPSLSRNSSVVLVTGKGSAGTGSPSRSQIGPHPSPGDHSISRLAGTSARTPSL
jgi:hypothetical protein